MRRRALLAAGLALGCARAAAPEGAVAESAERRLFEPRRLGWLSSRQTTALLPSAIALGGESSGRVLVYLEFDAPAEASKLMRAELLLRTGGAPGQSIDVELSRADAARGELQAWADQPRALYPRLRRRLQSDSELLRLDVTELVAAERGAEPLRLMLRAEPSAREPVLLVTGAAGGAAPELEAYYE